MGVRTTDGLAHNVSLANGLLNGNILLSTSSLSEQSAQTASVQTQNVGSGAQQLDQLDAQIKALHAQALSTQAAIDQLQVQDSHSFYSGFTSSVPWILGAEGLALGMGALILGGVIGWLAWRRHPVALQAPEPADFADSRMYLRERRQEERRQDSPPVAAQAPSVKTVVAMPERVFPQPESMEMDFGHSAPMAESDSVLGLFWAEPETAPPVAEPEGDLLEPLFSADASPFAPPSPTLEFDREAAANEVERVRKSLAEKRDARARERHYDDLPRIALHHAPMNAGGFMQDDREEAAEAQTPPDSPPVELALDLSPEQHAQPSADGALPSDEVDLALDLDLDVQDLSCETVAPPTNFLPLADAPTPDLAAENAPDGPGDPHEEAPEAVQEYEDVEVEVAQEDEPTPPVDPIAVVADEVESMVDFEFVAMAEAQDTEPKLPPPQSQPDVCPDLETQKALEAEVAPDPAVQFELAQEFQALGLLDGARELAMEVLGCSDATLRSQAQVLIDQLHAQETAQRVGELVDAPVAS